MKMRRWAGGLVICVVSSALLAPVLLAKPGVVKTTDGQTYDGEVTEKTDTVSVSVRGIETSLPRDKVSSITYAAAAGYETEFNAKLAKLDKKDIAGRLKLAREAFDGHHYDLARTAAEQAVQIDPNSTEAAKMRDNIQSQIRLERRSGTPANPASPPAVAATMPAVAPADRNFLSAADINTIRQLEIREDEDNVPIKFDKNVQRRYAAMQNMQVAEFTASKPIVQLYAILTKGSADMRGDVKVLRDPASLMEFRQKIEPMILTSCATNGCHGGPSGAGGLMLYNNPGDSDGAHHTNFYILQSYSRKSSGGGVFDGGDIMMINRTQPNKSLLVQFALPPAIAEYDHPAVQGYRSLLRDQQDVKYRLLVDWIGKSLVAVQPNYNINFKMPATRPATQPTTR